MLQVHEPPAAVAALTSWPFVWSAGAGVRLLDTAATCPEQYSDFPNAFAFLALSAVSGGGVSSRECRSRLVYDEQSGDDRRPRSTELCGFTCLSLLPLLPPLLLLLLTAGSRHLGAQAHSSTSSPTAPSLTGSSRSPS